MIAKRLGLIALLLGLGGCSTVMEANRPTPVDLTQFSLSEKRIDVVSKLGPPVTTVADGPRSCDVYRLYTRGVSRVGKGAIILGEAAADVFTLGLSEVAFTPGEAATKNNLHSVLMCYGPENTLRSMIDNGRTLASIEMVPAVPLAAAPPPAFPASSQR